MMAPPMTKAKIMLTTVIVTIMIQFSLVSHSIETPSTSELSTSDTRSIPPPNKPPTRQTATAVPHFPARDARPQARNSDARMGKYPLRFCFSIT